MFSLSTFGYYRKIVFVLLFSSEYTGLEPRIGNFLDLLLVYSNEAEPPGALMLPGNLTLLVLSLAFVVVAVV